ncbi:HNH endonuclease [Streptomyces albidoflavus]|uniref:HNH endonuclease n=2 Tax=Streptomyces TaxID=1883 RepID=UPI0001CE81D4|nr:HNH endonuclease [Streptomyces albidoflavus]EFE83316.1 conserved hypothetical protein [Streptomyces albidoflavus]MBL0781015.1 HNH endonuclease [Streptomyces albidoflavus]
MACTSGRPKLSDDQDRELFSESAGTCLICSTSLFPKDPRRKRSIPIAERAHIIAHSDEGPRADPSYTDSERAAPENIALLCPTCHTMVDKAPDEYPVQDLLDAKKARKRLVASIGGAQEFSNVAEARKAVQRILLRNQIIFQQHGPSPDDGSTDSTEGALAWSRYVRTEIIPNNRLIQALVDANIKFASMADLEAVELLRQHTDDLERKHRDRILEGPASRFPGEAENIFKGELA